MSFNLLERQGCKHVTTLAGSGTSIGLDSRDGSSGAIKVAARRVLTDYLVAHGREAARMASIARVSGVSFLFCEAFISLDGLHCYNCNPP